MGIARQAIRAELDERSDPPIEPADAPALLEQRGAFVTLYHLGQLRGCLGQVEGLRPLWQTVSRMAVAAATRDPRFSPLRLEELPETSLEVSVLSPLEPVPDPPRGIELGRHGVMVRQGGRSGVFLPKVAPRQGWDVEHTLRNAAIKAGRPEDAWRTGEVFRFEAEAFSDS